MFSSKIRAIRNLNNMSQKDFAKAMGTEFRTLQDYEYGKTQPRFDFLKKLIDTFNVDPTFLFDDSSAMVPQSKKISSAIQKNKFRNGSAIHSSPQESPNHQKIVSQSSKNCLPIHSSPQDLSLSQEKNVTKSESGVLLTHPSPPIDPNSYYIIPKLTLHAQAGGGNEILDLECYESGEMLTIDKAFFKVIPSYKLKAIKVEGYSMIPMLLPDSWVVFEERREYKGDGLYIINYAGQLMVKLLQLDPVRNILDIVSVNKEYKSYSIPLSESQVEFIIIGKVLRCII
ncbi:XRE family transcriptional regulator [Helicobacter cholecystus]|uniref:XRE family transcriptional regulator n=1 Tax=Helicobacter cholecystus TaxID=45498 RepID=UPI002738B1BC|nr:helix-turn-helix domain-containing protein [Helicobacter cholecystus]